MNSGDLIDGKYRVDRVLGEGGMGVVVAATHVILGNAVAIKVLKPAALAVPSVPARFLREARAAAALRGDHVGRVLDVGQLPTQEPYMVMEMLRGDDLAAVSRTRRLPVALAADYLVQACEGLAEAHRLGMIHRDIKPANLFLADQPNGSAIVKVLDFGIATQPSASTEHSLTRTETVMGSPAYMSPEQLKSAKHVDARSDIWSLGVTLYELLSGEQPFKGDSFSALAISIATEPHPSLRVDPIMAAVLDRCLAKEPAQRFQNVAELAAALSPLFSGGKTAALEVSAVLGESNQLAHATTEASLPGVAAVEPRSKNADTTGLRGESVTSPPEKRRYPLFVGAGLLVIAIPVVVIATRDSNAPSVAPSSPDLVVASAPPADASIPTVDTVMQEPKAPEPTLEHALTLRDRPLVALAETDRLIVTDPRSGPLHSYRAELLFAVSKPAEAIDELSSVVDPMLISATMKTRAIDYLRANPNHANAKTVAALLKIKLVSHVRDSRPQNGSAASAVVTQPPAVQPPPPVTVPAQPTGSATPPPSGSGSSAPRKPCKANDPECGL